MREGNGFFTSYIWRPVIKLKIMKDKIRECCSKNGFGTKTYKCGCKYEGQIENGKPHGYGTLTVGQSGTEYYGDFKDGKLPGWVYETLTNGEIFEGEFKDGNRNGLGVLTYQDGSTLLGEFEDGELISSKLLN